MTQSIRSLMRMIHDIQGHVMGGDVNQDPCTLAPEIAALYCLTVDGVQLPGIPKNKFTGWASYRWVWTQGTLDRLWFLGLHG